jgi:hypothetical protein
MDHFGLVNPVLSELIAPLCATQVAGQGFFLIPDCPLESNARERVNTAVVTVVKDTITAKQLEDELVEFSLKVGDGQSGKWQTICSLSGFQMLY